MMENQKGLLDYFYILLKWRWFIIINFLIVVLITYGITLLLPKWYYSESVVLPPRDRSAGRLMGLGSIAQMVGLGGPAGLIGNQELYSYISILKSRSVQEIIINEFDLLDVYKIKDKSMETALDELRSNVDINIDEEGALVVGVYDRDPERAAKMANRLIELLHQYNTELGVSEAKARRVFIERRLEQNEKDLAELEEKVKTLQREHGILIIPSQADEGIKGIADIYAARIIMELESDIAQEVFGRDNPIYRRTQLELGALDRKLAALPDQTIESLRIGRDFIIQQKIFEMLTPLLEEARLEELRDTPTVLVLDYAVPAEEKARPKRLLITLAMGIITLVFIVIYIVTLDSMNTLKTTNPEKYKYYEEIGMMLRNPFKRI